MAFFNHHDEFYFFYHDLTMLHVGSIDKCYLVPIEFTKPPCLLRLDYKKCKLMIRYAFFD